jgi:hypothetical protein
MSVTFPAGDRFDIRKVLLVLALLPSFSAAVASDSITGAVHNQTRGGQPAEGDDVVLIRLDQGMQEEARTKTDAQGAFALKVHDPAKLYLVRVVHQGVNYDQRVSAGEAVSIDIFDVAAKVKGVTGSIEIIRVGSSTNQLQLSDMVEIRNDSSPPITQAGERTFEVYLPATAQIDSVMAAGPAKIAVLISAAPVTGDPGHFTVNFPLRPGATKFAFNYHLPYAGRAAFRSKLAYPLQQLAVMIPPTMKFSSTSPAFQTLATGVDDYQVETANQLKAGDGPSFELSGLGPMAALQPRPKSTMQLPTSSASGPAVAGPASAGSPLPFQTASSHEEQKGSLPPSPARWWVVGTITIAGLGVFAFVIWRTRHRVASETEERRAPSPPSLLDTLKEELFRLETDKVSGAISREEYYAAKHILDGTFQRAAGYGNGRGSQRKQ